MKVLHLIDSEGLYGAENVVLNLTLGLRELGAESVIGCFSYQNKPLPEVGVQAESMGLDCVYFMLRNKVDVGCVKAIGSYCKKNAVRVVHSHGYKPSVVCLIMKLLYGTPYVITCHLWILETFRLRIYTSLEKISMRFAERVIGVSEEIVTDLNRGGISKRKLRVIENGIDVDRYSEFKLEPKDAGKVREELGLDRDSFIIGSLGRLTGQKDYQTLIRAAAEALTENEALEFIVAGEGELRSALVGTCRELGIERRFHFLGFRSDREKLLKLMSVFVLSSLDEGLPMAMLEAMAAGLPIVTTPVGGIPGVIRSGENGLFIEPGNVEQLKEALLLLAGNSAMREKLGKRASETVKSAYSIEKMAQKYLAIYNNRER